MNTYIKYILTRLFLLPSSLFALNNSIGEELSLFSLMPFCGILLSIALFPIILPVFWHKNFGKISLFWICMLLIPLILWKGFLFVFHEITHVFFLEYIPFILLLFSLYTISGGIRIKGELSGSPKMNVAIISIGIILASWMGTTGASMLLIRPILRANRWRKYRVHTIVFFIFLVANIGGALTPLGDPPLFLGFLQGISFFWTTKALLIPMLFMSFFLLIIYYLLDLYFYKKEDKEKNIIVNDEAFSIDGKINFILMMCVVLSVLMSGFWNPHIILTVFGTHLELQNILRDVILFILAMLSLRLTDNDIRVNNHFSWFPMVEVSKLFAGIFITIIPAIAILKAGNRGALGDFLMIVSNSEGLPINSMYFWMTGILSSFLDNAPTYLIFFNMAGSNVSQDIANYLMFDIPQTLLAISMGAVFMGAMTYIGNAPNFMIRSIAEEDNVKMPSFFGFMAWSIIVLIPLLIILSYFIF